MFFFLLGSECGAVLEPAPGQSNCGSAISGKMLIPIGQKGDLIFLSLDWRDFLIGQRHQSLPWKMCRSFALVTPYLPLLKPYW